MQDYEVTTPVTGEHMNLLWWRRVMTVTAGSPEHALRIAKQKNVVAPAVQPIPVRPAPPMGRLQ